MQKSYSAKPADIERKWLLIDAKDLVLGRVASLVASILRGKNKPCYTPHIDCGDNVIIINADKIHLTGKKLDEKTYYWHTGYPGGIKSRTAKEVIKGKTSTNVVRNAITKMISRNPLGREQLRKLYVYAGDAHPHAGQKPEIFDVSALNNKNSKR